MKKKSFLFILLFLVLFFCGCKTLFTNEIYNKSYEVRIDIIEFQDVVAAAIEKAAPAVVGVSNYEKNILAGYKLASTGSGVIYECRAQMKNGDILDDCSKTKDSDQVEEYIYDVVTNKHVILSEKKLSNKIRVYLGDEDEKIDATVLGYDSKIDLAVIRFSHSKYIQPIEFADSNALKRGNFAIAIGNPSGYDFYGTSTFGTISFPRRYMSDDTDGDGINDWDAEYIQHDVAINPGNSGGALINIKGELIGINTLKIVSGEIDNMGFAIPSNLVKEIADILASGKTPQRYTLGISVYEVKTILNKEDYEDGTVPDVEIPDNINYGLYVSEIDKNGLAFGKLEVGDIILEFNNVKINKSKDFRTELGKMLKGDSATIDVYRNNKIVTITFKFK